MTDRPRSQAELEATFRDFVDPEYSDALEQASEGLGFDTVAAGARVLERASSAIARNGQAFFVLPHSRQTDAPASGAVRASGPVTVGRTGNAQVELRIPAGKRLLGRLRGSTGLEGVVQAFALAEEVVLVEGELGPVTVLAQATRPGNQGNLPSGVLVGLEAEGVRTVSATSSGGNTLTDTGVPDVFTAGDVGRYCRLTPTGLPIRILSFGQDPGGRGMVSLDGAVAAGTYAVRLLEWAELGVVLEQPVGFDNGRHGQLDAIGRETLISRGPGEADLDYAYRISSLPDVVAPNAIRHICSRILSPLGVEYEIHEATLGLWGFTLDQTPLDAGSVCARGGPWEGQVLLTQSATRRYFVVCVDSAESAGAYGLPRDALNAGRNAYDVGEAPGDGAAVGYDHAIQTLYQALSESRGYGVGFKLLRRRAYVPLTFLDVDLTLDLTATSSPYVDAATAALEQFFFDNPGTAQAWQLQQAVETVLAQAGLNPSCAITAITSLSAGPGQALRLGDLTVA